MATVTDAQLREVLSLEPIAVVGFSTTPVKDAHTVPTYLIDQGYDVIPVNPNAEEVANRTSYASLSEIDREVAMVDVFRPSEEVPGIVDEAIERGDVSVIWLQTGITHDAAAERAREAGITVIQNRCMRIQHQRLMG